MPISNKLHVDLLHRMCSEIIFSSEVKKSGFTPWPCGGSSKLCLLLHCCWRFEPLQELVSLYFIPFSQEIKLINVFKLCTWNSQVSVVCLCVSMCFYTRFCVCVSLCAFTLGSAYHCPGEWIMLNVYMGVAARAQSQASPLCFLHLYLKFWMHYWTQNLLIWLLWLLSKPGGSYCLSFPKELPGKVCTLLHLPTSFSNKGGKKLLRCKCLCGKQAHWGLGHLPKSLIRAVAAAHYLLLLIPWA